MVAWGVRALVVAVTVVAVAATTTACSDGGGGPCDPTHTCSADGFVTWCMDGLTYVEGCSDGLRCNAGACQPVVCKASLFFCDGDMADSCDATGTVHTRVDCARDGARCVVGPLAADCQPLACTPSTTYCSPDGAEVRKCSGDGRAFTIVQRCDDPLRRGNRCVGASCRDRCAILEAQDRSTLGCRFSGALFASAGSGRVRVGNPQVDLPATVDVSVAGNAIGTLVVAPGASADLTVTAGASSSTSQTARAVTVASTLPVYTWLEDLDGRAMHPEHALSLDYRAAIADTQAPHTLAITAVTHSTAVTVTPSGPILAGGTLGAAPAGVPFTRMLAAGEVLTLASSTSLTGTHVSSTRPVTVEIAARASLTVPGTDTWGRDVVVDAGGVLIAREATTVTTERDGTLALGAGASATLSAGQRVHATAPIFVAGAGELYAPVEQWRALGFSPEAAMTLVATAPSSVMPTVAGAPIALAPSATGSYARATATQAPLQLFVSSMPFFAWYGSSGATPGAYGLSVLP